MEPFGAVTKFYPLLSDETRRIVDETTENTVSYHEFVTRLVDVADSHPMESELACFTLIQSELYPDSWQKMQARCPESVATRPFALLSWDNLNNYDASIPKEFQEEFHHSMEKAVLSEPFDWLLADLYYYAEIVSTEPMRTKYYDALRDLIKTHPNLHCFSSMLYRIDAQLQRREGDIDASLQSYDRAIEITSTCNDIIIGAISIMDKGSTIKDVDIHRALQLHDEAYSMVADRLSEFDATYLFAAAIGLTYEVMGEFDLALRFYQRKFELMSRLADSAPYILTVVASRVYCELGMPQQALEWLRSRSSTLQFEESLLHSYTANAFVLLGQYDDAASHLVRANKIASESGDDVAIILYLLARGKYEAAHGEFDLASNSLQEALDLGSPQFQVIVNYALTALTQVEIERVIGSQEFGLSSQTSGPWMSRLEEHALERSFPGIRIQHALLKADYQSKIGKREDAMYTLQEALSISDSPGVKTLRKRINERLEELVGIPH